MGGYSWSLYGWEPVGGYSWLSYGWTLVDGYSWSLYGWAGAYPDGLQSLERALKIAWRHTHIGGYKYPAESGDRFP